MSSNENGTTASAAGNNNKKTKIPRSVQNGWFTETEIMWPGQRFSLALENSPENSILYNERSDFQEIMVFQSAQYGRVLVIDGILQLTERDAFAFHEMMAHVPLFSHRNPQSILIVGGGDGAILKEVLRHNTVKKVVLVEIDPKVIEVCQTYLSGLVPPEVFQDPRVEIIHADAAEFLKDAANRDRFDVILADTLDPCGPAESLFEPEFYESMHDSLRSGGIICTQGECMWIHLDLIRDLVSCCADMFDYVEYASTGVPSYPCGQIGFILARKGQAFSCRSPVRAPAFQNDLKWYNPSIHRAAFALPQYIRQDLEPLNMINLDGDDDEQEVNEQDCFLDKCTIQ